MPRHCWLPGLVVALWTLSPLAADEDALDTLRQQADVAYRQRDFPTTIELTDQILGQNSQDHVGLYLRGSARVEMGIVTGNVQQLRDGIADAREAIRHEGTGKPEYYLPYIYGMSHLSTLEGKPVHARTALTVADSVLEREDLDEQQQANLHYQRAQANIRLNDLSSAEQDLQQALGLHPKHLAAQMTLAEVTAKSKSPAEALKAYTGVVEAFPDNPVTYNNRGMFLQSQGKTEQAITDFTKAIEIDERFIPAYINRGFAYLESGDSNRAEAAFSEAINLDPSQAGALSLRATARLNQNKSEQALADYKRVVQMAPHNPMSHADLGFAQFFLADYAQALESFRAARKLNEQMRFLLPWQLASEIRVGQVQQENYRESLSKPEDQRDWIDHLVHFQLGQLDAASLLNSVNQTDRQAGQAQLCEGYYFIGLELQRRNRSEDAVAYFRQAAQRKLPKLSAYRGAVYALQNGGQTVR
jgi:tetratricopeptide (TPR) repeat protein